MTACRGARRAAAAVALLAAARAAAAGGPGSAFGEGLRLTNTAWAMGMSEALIAAGEGVTAISLNPAGVGDSAVTTLHATHAFYVEGLSEDYLAYAQRLPLGSAFGVSVHGLYDLGAGRTLEDAAGNFAGDAGTFPLAFAVGGAAFAQDLTAWIGGLDAVRPSAGLGLRAVYQRVDRAEWLGVTADLGFKLRPGGGFLVGGVLENLGGVRGSAGLPLQWVTAVAWAHERVFGPADRFLVEADAPVAVDRPVFPRVGGEYRWRPGGAVTIALRGGWKADNQVPGSPGLAAGVGFRWALGLTPWGLDYAFEPWGVLGGVHAISVTVGLLPRPAPVVDTTPSRPPERVAPEVVVPLKGEVARTLVYVKEPAELSAFLLDTEGRRIMPLLERKVVWAGNFEVTWDGRLPGGAWPDFDHVYRILVQVGDEARYHDVVPKRE